ADLMTKMPDEILKAFGMDENTWSSILGFYNTYYGIYIIVLLSIYTTSTAATIISKEEKYRTAEFLLTKPISRSSVFWTKIGSLLSLCIFIFAVQTLFAIFGIITFGDDSTNWSTFGIMTASGLVLMIFFTC